MKDGYRVPLRYRILRRVMKPLARGIFHLLANVRITGKENIPYGKPYVVATNHVSMFDPPFIAAFWPEWLEIIGASNVFDKPFEGTILKMYGVIPVHRGEYDRALLTKIVHILKSGLPLLIAPEGGRSHVTAMRRAKPGIAYIVEQTGLPVLPTGLVGTTEDFFQRSFRRPKPILEMHIGKPIILPEIETKGTQRHEMRQHSADLVMSYVAGLLPEEYRGEYAGTAIRPA
ncbi:MAG: lysophospholipid acyltransferase family protein [Anaerolineales bacterium]